MIVDLSVVTLLNKNWFLSCSFFFRVSLSPVCACLRLNAHPLIQVKCFFLPRVSLNKNLSCKSHQTLFSRNFFSPSVLCGLHIKCCFVSSPKYLFHPPLQSASISNVYTCKLLLYSFPVFLFSPSSWPCRSARAS